MIDKLLEQRIELLNDMRSYIIMGDDDKSRILRVAISDLDEIIKLYKSNDTVIEEENIEDKSDY